MRVVKRVRNVVREGGAVWGGWADGECEHTTMWRIFLMHRGCMSKRVCVQLWRAFRIELCWRTSRTWECCDGTWEINGVW